MKISIRQSLCKRVCLSTNSARIFCGCHGSRSHVPQGTIPRRFLQTSQQTSSPAGQDFCHRGQQQQICDLANTARHTQVTAVLLVGKSLWTIRTARYPGLILDMLLIGSAGIKQDRRKVHQRPSLQSPCLVRRSCPSIRSSILPPSLIKCECHS